MKKNFPLILLLLSCSSLRTTYIEYKGVTDISSITDSIKLSGTTLGQEASTVFTLDDGSKDTVYFRSLYKENEATGSFQVRRENGLYNVSIIDKIKKK